MQEIITGAVSLGLLWAVMTIGVYISYSVLGMADMTAEGSITMGAAIAAKVIAGGGNPYTGLVLAILCGMAAGLVNGLLHTKLKIPSLLSGILTMTALFSINLRIMGKANLPLMRSTTVFSGMKEAELLRTWVSVAILAVLIVVIGLLLYWFLGTSYGVALRATGDNELMARSQGINTGATKIVGLALSNGLVALCGSLMAQYTGFADISMGIGLIVAGLASVIVGQAIFGMTAVWQAILAAALGSVIYRSIIQAALSAGLDPNDMKLISAVLVVLALVLPNFGPLKQLRVKRRAQKALAAGGN